MKHGMEEGHPEILQSSHTSIWPPTDS